jgi:hypothetical protein
MAPGEARFAILFPLLLIAGCDQASSDLAAIKTSRSLAAERALVARLDSDGRLRRTYSENMQRAAVKQLLSEREALSRPDDAAGQAIGAAALLPDQAVPLRAAARHLSDIEARREDH